MTDAQAGLTEDLRSHILAVYSDGPRRDSRWVMSPEWLNECRKIEDGTGHSMFRPSWTIDAPQKMLGIPIDVRADGGVPHLEH